MYKHLAQNERAKKKKGLTLTMPENRKLFVNNAELTILSGHQLYLTAGWPILIRHCSSMWTGPQSGFQSRPCQCWLGLAAPGRNRQCHPIKWGFSQLGWQPLTTTSLLVKLDMIHLSTHVCVQWLAAWWCRSGDITCLGGEHILVCLFPNR